MRSQRTPRKNLALDQPSEKHILGLELDEISGIQYLPGSKFAAVHDEEGRLFIYDWNEKKVTDRIKFGKSGDYEDLELVEDLYYILRSDGRIYEFNIAGSDDAESYKTPLKSSNDAEGLTYIEESNQLLIALKGQGEVDNNKADGKGFYTFDLEKKEMSVEPLFTIRKRDIEYALPDSLIHEPFANPVDFSPSAVAFHPITKQLYILSHQTKWLVILNRDYTIYQAIPLMRKVFRQPEGITFAPNGDLYISNEAEAGSANILKFEYKEPR